MTLFCDTFISALDVPSFSFATCIVYTNLSLSGYSKSYSKQSNLWNIFFLHLRHNTGSEENFFDNINFWTLILRLSTDFVSGTFTRTLSSGTLKNKNLIKPNLSNSRGSFYLKIQKYTNSINLLSADGLAEYIIVMKKI